MGQININNNIITYDDKYSKKDFTQRNLLDAIDLENKVIYGSCFSQEAPDTKVFPDNVQKMTFYNCNLDNVFMVKPGWVTIGCSERRYKVQLDRNDWLIDINNKPTMPINHKIFTKLGLPMPLPKDIPAQEVNEVVDLMSVAKTKQAEIL